MKLTKQQIRDYVDHGFAHCPSCKSGQIEGSHIEVDGNQAWQKVHCNDCGIYWNDIYKLVDVEILED